eukprot:CAMPEP_0194268376 /NCGR_PEP_ID=MMETSP0169-20130528/2724_1 /TAXON_ID=218684 /ORGANISM="Corethron pennatum, Strain L29A3" /LENGTH=72 /DNA_ID=CAMNT_0039009593 /DNA_START=129 /DNA_END=344 /DNA_ORIENTATION=-
MRMQMPALAKLLSWATAALLVHLEIAKASASTSTSASTCASPPELINGLPDNTLDYTYVQNQIQWLQSKKGG